MARPSKAYKVQRNGDSLQVFEAGVYVGSMPIKVLCEMIKAQKSRDRVLHTVSDSTQFPLK